MKRIRRWVARLLRITWEDLPPAPGDGFPCLSEKDLPLCLRDQAD